jgi:alkaline phosphatase D
MSDPPTRRPVGRRLSRRGLIQGALTAAVSLPGRPTHLNAAIWPADRRRAPTFAADPFSLGVASGEPAPDGVVLWTRLAPDPLAEDGLGGLTGSGPIEVGWEVADGGGFARVVRRGVAVASPELAHAVHVDVDGLEPGRDYFYRFIVGDVASPIGRTWTVPPAGVLLDRLRVAVASCQNWEDGLYTAYADLARQEVDLVLHLGDYVYEGVDSGEVALQTGGIVRRHPPFEAITLADYRRRYALYKSDPHLQAAHAAAPWVTIWDDHEVVNDYAAEAIDGRLAAPEFLDRRAAAYQANYEHLPLRADARPSGATSRRFRRLAFGDLLALHLLDTRQYRSLPPCGPGIQEPCPEWNDPAATMLGAEQETWLAEGLAASPATWNVIGQQILMARLDLQTGSGATVHDRIWDAYPAARARLLTNLNEAAVPNPIVLTGDIHSSWVNDLHLDAVDPASPLVATEFVGTSVTSGGDPTPALRLQYRAFAATLGTENPHVRYFDGERRGYVLHDISPKLWRARYRHVAAVKEEGSPVETAATFVVEAGRPGVLRA